MSKEYQQKESQFNEVVERVITAKETPLDGFSVKRILPTRAQRMVGPWIFFDHMGPITFKAGTGVNVRPHPHINLATVTYLFEGEILHRDSLGNQVVIKPGEINLMVAGKGITHSERERAELREIEHKINGLQLWHALPVENEEMDPEFHHYVSHDIPKVSVDGIEVNVLIGQIYGCESPVKTFAQTLYIEAKLTVGQSLSIPPEVEERALYIVNGEGQIANQSIEAFTLVVLTAGKMVTITAKASTVHLVVLGGEPLEKRYMWWNFVSSRKERLELAKQDWAQGKFPVVVNDREEFIPLPNYT